MNAPPRRRSLLRTVVLTLCATLVGAVAAALECRARTLGPDLQLFAGGGAEGVAGGQHHAVIVFLQPVRQLGGGAEAIESARDAARHGADSGFHGFIYYAETVAFFKRHLA